MKKIFLTFLTVYSFFIQTTIVTFAKPQSRHLAGKNNKLKKRIAKKQNSSGNKKTETKLKLLENIKTEPLNKEETKANLTCEEKYNICMDNVCKNDEGIRYYCDKSIDSFETVTRDNEKFRIGNDLYTFALEICDATLNSCSLKEQNHIKTTYEAQIKEDLLTKNYIDAIKAESDKTVTDLFNEYESCMKNLCGDYFSDCFTIKNIERRSENCKTILSKTSRPLAVKKMFYDKMFKTRGEFCKKMGGTIHSDTKKCKINVSYGTPEIIKINGQKKYSGKATKIAQTKMFNYGEIVECTQEFFSTNNTYKPGFMEGIKKLVFSGIRIISGLGVLIAGAVESAAAAVGAAFTGGVSSFGLVHSTSMMLNGGSLMCKGVADGLNGAVLLNTDVKEGACFINNKFVAPMNQYFKIDFSVSEKK